MRNKMQYQKVKCQKKKKEKKQFQDGKMGKLIRILLVSVYTAI